MVARAAKKPPPVRIKLAPGVLRKFGYASTLSAHKRRKALAMAIVARGKEKKIDRRAAALSIFQRLNVLVLYRKNSPPSKAKAAFEADKAWVKKTYGLAPPRRRTQRALRRGQLTHLKQQDRRAMGHRLVSAPSLALITAVAAPVALPLAVGGALATVGATGAAANLYWYKQYLQDRADWIKKGLKVSDPSKWEIAMATYKPPDAEHTNVPLDTKIRLNGKDHWLKRDSQKRLYWSTVNRGPSKKR